MKTMIKNRRGTSPGRLRVRLDVTVANPRAWALAIAFAIAMMLHWSGRVTGATW